MRYPKKLKTLTTKDLILEIKKASKRQKIKKENYDYRMKYILHKEKTK